MAFAWIPKATVQAAISGIVLTSARNEGLVEGSEYDYETAGRAIVTTAVCAIVITAPLGAILTNTLGPMWLTYDVKKKSKRKPTYNISETEL